MLNLNVMITRLLKAVQASSSSPAIQWLMRILALSQAITPAQWPQDYRLEEGQTFDFVVVGSGSAGATVAARLSEVPYFRVLLIEAGEDPPLASVVPSLFVTLTKTEYDWAYGMKTVNNIAQAHDDQTVSLIRGKVLGGSSSLNYELYARGEPKDYDDWGRTAPGWDWDSVLHYFKKLENMTDPTVLHNPRSAFFHSTEGPVKISRPPYNEYFQRINNKILESYEEVGVKRVEEMNGPDNLGASLPHFTFYDGRRSSTAESYLIPAKDRENLYVAKYACVTKVLIDPNNAKAYGVKVLTRSGLSINVYVTKEVILSAGSINTPKILMLSGIGPKEELDKFNIKTLMDLPVGKNLQDHPFVPIIISGERGLHTAFQNVLSITELNAVPVPTQNAFINLSRPDGKRQLQLFNAHVGAFASPVVQIGCEFVSYRREFCASIAKVNLLRAIDMTLMILLHPYSRGRVTLRSTNPLDDPVIDSGYLTDERDVDVLSHAVKFIHTFVNTTYYRSVGAIVEKLNIRGCDKFRSDENRFWRCYVKNSIGSLQHPVGTCAIGEDGVVDERLNVHGIRGLRVVDASVMPLIPGGNTNAPTIMIGEKAADMINEEYGGYSSLNTIEMHFDRLWYK